MNYLFLYLQTSEKKYDEENNIVFYLTQDKDFTDCPRTYKRWIENRFDTRFEAALVNVGEAVVFISKFLEKLSKEDRQNIESTVYLRNDIQNEIMSGEHFDIYEMLKYLPYPPTNKRYYNQFAINTEIFINQIHNVVALHYDEIKVKWFDKIIHLMQKWCIKIKITNAEDGYYQRDKQRLDNFRKTEIRQQDSRRTREKKGIEFVFEHLRGKDV